MEAATGAEGVGVITAGVILGAVILKTVDMAKYIVQGVRGDWNGFLTLMLTWVLGFAVVFLFMQTPWAEEVTLGKQTLDDLDFWGQVVFAFAAPSIASLLYDAKKAVDKTDTASTPRLTGDAETARKANVALSTGVPIETVARGTSVN